jgi:starvation-inducible DNA-binding protein
VRPRTVPHAVDTTKGETSYERRIEAIVTDSATQVIAQDRVRREVPRGLGREGVIEISRELRHMLADVFTLYLKTKNFHWHMSGIHFRDYHLLLDEHGEQIFAMTDVIAERARKLGEATFHSIGDISRHQRLKDNDSELMAPQPMLAELCEDNQRLTQSLRLAHELCDRQNDVATASLIETWIDETERRVWFLSEIQIGSNQS